MIEGIENAYPHYGLPKKKKYPLPDRKHVLSAIRFFNYVSPQDEKQLAEAILEKIKEYGMKDVGVGPDNRFLKYYKKDADHLEHHGILGQKWGIRRFQNPDGTLTAEGKARYGQQRGYEARQMYKRGEISREEYKSRMKPDSAFGKIDNALNLGLGRRVREFEQRHKAGVIAVNAVLPAVGSLGMIVLGANPLVATGYAAAYAASGAIGAVLGTALNDIIVEKAYNDK